MSTNKFPYKVRLEMVYDDPKKENVCFESEGNMWTDYFLAKMFGSTYTGNITTTWIGIGNSDSANNKRPSYITLSEYDVPHSQTSSQVYGNIKANKSGASVGYTYDYNYTFYSDYGTDTYNQSGYPCIVSMRGTSSATSLMRNFHIPGFSFVWDSETFYIDKTLFSTSWLSSGYSSGTSVDVYDGTQYRVGQYARFYSSSFEQFRVTSINTNTINFSGGGVTGTYLAGSTLHGDCCVAYTNKTTLASQAVSGATTLSATDASNFQAGQYLMLDDNTNFEGVYVDSIATNDITITGGLINTFNAGSTLYGGFKSSHGSGTQLAKRDFYQEMQIYYTFTSGEATGYGTSPIRTIAFCEDTGSYKPFIIILLPYGIYKDAGTYSGTLYVSYQCLLGARCLS